MVGHLGVKLRTGLTEPEGAKVKWKKTHTLKVGRCTFESRLCPLTSCVVLGKSLNLSIP